MFFTFWIDPGSAGVSAIESSTREWQSVCPEFKVYADDLISDLLIAHDFDKHNLYNLIRIPSCRSDIARLVLLYEFGGMYVDAHTGVGNPWQLASVLGKLATHELILFDKRWEHVPAQPFSIINGAICARRSSAIIKYLIKKAFRNLKELWDLEISCENHAPYNIAVLTGGWHIYEAIFNLSKYPHEIHDYFSGGVCLARCTAEYDHGVVFHKYHGYQNWQNHWSERQKFEKLFKCI